jgi:hypothetical protein
MTFTPFDAKIAEQFRSRSRELIDPKGTDPLGRVLRERFHGLICAYVIHWVPEQGEDIYTVVIGPQKILTVEIARPDPVARDPIVESVSVREYRRRRLPKHLRRKMEIAMKLAEEDASAQARM